MPKSSRFPILTTSLACAFSPKTRARFSTGREFGGPEKLLLGVTIHRENTGSFPCSESTLESSALDIGNLNLRVSRSEFASLASDQLEQLDDGYVDFELAYHRELTDADSYEVEYRDSIERRS